MQDLEIFKAFERSEQPCYKHTTYFDTYEHLFSRYRGQAITFVEIGILDGGSLFMWREYFGPKARIIGVDLNPEAKKWEQHGFEIFTGSQSNPEFWHSFISEIGSIDIVLDDGGHTYQQQIVTAECLLDSISDGGLLVVEDCHTSYMPGFGDHARSFINYAKTWVDRINSRFGKFYAAKAQGDRRVWSIEFYESIVAFRVNRKSSMALSAPIRNKNPETGAKDYRHEDAADSIEASQRLANFVKAAFEIYK